MSVERDPPPAWRPPLVHTVPVRPAGPTPTEQSRTLAAERGAFAKALERAGRGDAAMARERHASAATDAGEAPSGAGAARGAAGDPLPQGARGSGTNRGAGSGPGAGPNGAVTRDGGSAERASPERGVFERGSRRGEQEGARGGTRREAMRDGDDEAGTSRQAHDDDARAIAPQREALRDGSSPAARDTSLRAARAGQREDDNTDSVEDREPVVGGSPSSSATPMAPEAGGRSAGATAMESAAVAADLARRVLDAPSRAEVDGGSWRFTVLGGIGDVASLQLRQGEGGAWHVRVALRPDAEARESGESELEARLRGAGVALADVVVAPADALEEAR